MFRRWMARGRERGRERVEVDRATWRLMITALLGAAVSSLFNMPTAGVGFCFLGLASAAVCAQHGRLDQLVRRWQHRVSATPTPPGMASATATAPRAAGVPKAGDVLTGFGVFLLAGTGLALGVGSVCAALLGALLGPPAPGEAAGLLPTGATAATVVLLSLVHDTAVFALARLVAVIRERVTDRHSVR